MLGIGLMLLIAIGFFYPMLFGDQVTFYRDYNLITYPIRHFLGQMLQQGVIPYWVPHAHGGMPFMATFHPGVFYPPSVLFFLEDTTYALNLFYVLHYMVLGVFTFLLARAWGISFASSLCCGIMAMLSGFIFAATLVSNFFISAVWLPAVFWMFHRYWTRKRTGYFVGLVLAIATQTLASCPEINIMTMLLLYAHALYFLPRSPGWAGIARLTTAMGIAVVLALGISALQLVPTAKMVKHSFRDGGLSFEAHSSWSLPPENLKTLLVSPDYQNFFETQLVSGKGPKEESSSSSDPSVSELSGSSIDHSSSVSLPKTKKRTGLLNTYYMGLVGMVFVLLGFWFRREKAIGFWMAVLLVGIFLALGKYNPVYKYIYSMVPFLDMFRYPDKYFYVSTFAIIFLTGYGLDFLIRGTRERSIKLFPVLALLIFLIGLCGWASWSEKGFNPEYSLALLGVFTISYLIFYYGKMKESAFVVMVIMIVLLDLSIKGTKLLPLIDRKYYDEKPVLLDTLNDSSGEYRIYSDKIDKKPEPYKYVNGPTPLAAIIGSKELLLPYTGMIYSVEHVNGWVGLALTLDNQELWLKVYVHSLPERRRRILKRSNVKYWIDRDTPLGYFQGYPVILPDRIKIFEDALPRAFLVPKMKIPEEGNHPLNVYYHESFNPLQEVILTEPVEFKESISFNGQVQKLDYSPNHVTVKTSQEGNGFLVLLDSHFPGWTVKVDGEERPILKANQFYRAVQLGPGKHTLEFDFFPEGFKTGLVISGVSLFLLILGVFILGNQKNKPSSLDNNSEVNV